VSDDRPAWRKQLEQSFAELEALGKQVGSKLGDAAKDASHEAQDAWLDAWRKLEPRLGELRTKVQEQVGGSIPSPDHVTDQVKTKLREVRSEAVEQLEGMVAELRSSLKALRDEL